MICEPDSLGESPNKFVEIQNLNSDRFIFSVQRVECTNKRTLMEKMGAVEPTIEELLEQKKHVRNPFVPVGAFMTAGILTAGLISFRRGNSHLGQILMRARVVVQGATVALMVGTAHYYGDTPWKSK